MIYKGDLLLFSSVYNKKALKNVKGDVDVQKEFLYIYKKKKEKKIQGGGLFLPRMN
jgi:hypothetical protein